MKKTFRQPSNFLAHLSFKFGSIFFFFLSKLKYERGNISGLTKAQM